MALDREKTFANAERLLKQGKSSQALEECQRLAEDAPKDLLMLNRIGDLLARGDRGVEAIVYYDKIADQFSASGFYPKAIAILKKIIKVDPNRLATIVRLGELNLKQKLPGEARAWFLQAADAYLRAHDFAKARDVYEKLVAAEPDNFVHAVRLAEARAAEGDAPRAGADLVVLGGRMIAAGRTDDAERTLKRASELLPGRAEPLAGLARVHAAAGRRDEAVRLADEAWPSRPGAEAVSGDLLVLFEALGDTGRAVDLLGDPKSDGISDDAIEQVMRAAIGKGTADDLWSRLGSLLDRWTRAQNFARSVALLDRLARIEEGGHLRALEQLVEVRKAEGNRPAAARAIERLVRAYQSKGLTGAVEAHLDTLKLFDPVSPLLFTGRPAGKAEAPVPVAAVPAPGSDAVARRPASAPIAAVFEAPAVPLGPADEEFVSGHLTEAEVFEKYGLHNEALQQLRQVAARFPGHVAAQEKLVGLLRTRADRGALRDALAAFAFAKRAAGDSEGAKRAAVEAASLGGIESAMRTALEALKLLEPGTGPAEPAAATPAPAPAPSPSRAAVSTAPAPPSPPKPAAPVAAKPAAPAPPSKPAPPVTSKDEDDLEIMFDDAEEIETPAAASSDSALEEIEFYIGQGMYEDALRRIHELRAAGTVGAVLDTLEARARAGQAHAEPAVVQDETPSAIEDRLDEEDLSSIAAALEAEYGADRAGRPAAAEPDAEQSLDEVFSVFKEHVRAEVDSEDFRTHYDLGIAYKEMGLVDDALAEFRVATGAPELYREACSMLGLCHGERNETEEAIRWYRAALDAPGDEDTPLSGLRYDLAEILLKSGDERGAYELFAQVAAIEPAYREVGERLSELRARLAL
jgi:tetratricopeptide (TPR) repeat protein